MAKFTNLKFTRLALVPLGPHLPEEEVETWSAAAHLRARQERGRHLRAARTQIDAAAREFVIRAYRAAVQHARKSQPPLTVVLSGKDLPPKLSLLRFIRDLKSQQRLLVDLPFSRVTVDLRQTRLTLQFRMKKSPIVRRYSTLRRWYATARRAQ